MDSVSEIKARIPIEELVAQYVQLKKVGRNFKALCPFHKERTPSFYVNPERQLAYCFGCRKGGDHFKFIEEIEGLDFRGALQFLAERAGIELPKFAPEDKHKKSERDRLIEMHEKAADFFAKKLFEEDGKKALSYFKKRDVTEETIKSARLGFAPDGPAALYSYLLEKGFARAEILTAGLAIARDTEQGNCVDRFRRRLIFPLKNLSGGICAFGGRALEDKDEPKYLNSPETPVYHKSSLLYGLSEARDEIRKSSVVVVVEGYMDALTARQAGFKNVVACGGTALTEAQFVLLKRFAKNLIFAFDRDNAGKMATERSIEFGFASEFSIRVAVWKSKAKDPDECIRDKPKIFEEALQTAFPAAEYLLNSFVEMFDTAAAEGKRKVIEGLLPFLNRVASPVELDCWLKQCSAKLDVPMESLYDELKRFQGKQKFVRIVGKNAMAAPEGSTPELKENFKIQEYLIGLLLTYPEIRTVANQFLQPEDFEDNQLQNIYRSLTSEYNQTLDEETASRANVLAMFAESLACDLGWEAVELEARETIKTLLRQKFDREKRTIVTRLREAQGATKMSLLDSYQEFLEKEERLISRMNSYGKEV